MIRSLATRSVVAIGAMCLLLAGCWLQPDFNAGHTRSNPIENRLTAANVALLQQAWSVDLAGPLASEPMISGSTVYFGHGDSAAWAARALDIATGALRWDRPLTTGNEFLTAVDMPLAFVGDELWTSWVGVTDTGCGTNLARLNPGDGTIIETQSVLPLTPPAVAGSLFAQVRSIPFGGVCDPTNGEVDLVVGDVDSSATVWSTFLADSGSVFPQVSVVGSRVFVTFPAASAYPLDHCDPAPTTTVLTTPSCTPIWSASGYGRSLTGPLVAGPGGQLFRVGGVSFPGATDGQVLAISQDTGELLWRAPYNATDARIAVGGGYLYVATSGSGTKAGTLQVFDADGCGGATCTPLWSATVGTSASVPTVAGGVVYVAAGAGVVRAFDATGCGAATCSELASVTVAGSVGALSVGEGHLLVTSNLGSGQSSVTAFAQSA